MDLAYIGTITLLILGFGFVVFWHELGHFLAAKWAGVKVEQFAIGFGHAIVSWRKGLGFRWGSSTKEYEQRLRDHVVQKREADLRLREQTGFTPEQLAYAAQELGIGETEYRLNWLPLGGYVKMLGQDDMNPNAQSDDPRSYTNKPISKRMVIVSAGVVMNVILAAILFMGLFLMGFNAPPAVVGSMQIGSPAQRTVRVDGTTAPLQVGDRILYFDDKYQHDFTKITLAVALAGPGQTLMYVERADGTRERLYVTPTRQPGENAGFVMLGVSPTPVLSVAELKPELLAQLPDEEKQALEQSPVRPGERVVEVQGQPVEVKQYFKLDRAIQAAFGQPVEITVENASGKREKRQVASRFGAPFGNVPLNFAGLAPRVLVKSIEPTSSVKGKLQPGDVITAIAVDPQGDTVATPTIPKLQEVLDSAGRNDLTVDVTVLRNGAEQKVNDLRADYKNKTELVNRRGLGIQLNYDVNNPIVAHVVEDSPAARAGIVRGATINAIDGQAVASWYDVHRLLAQHDGKVPPQVAFTTPQGEQRTVAMELRPDEQLAVRLVRYDPIAALDPRIEPRKTNNPAVAAWWGVTETRDLIIQFYLTLQRMAQGRVSPTNLMGPIGIVNAGSKIAYKGNDWLIWFLAMISANLAVVNFLPIPIVDGGLFVFLILEKIMGRPLSPRAQSIAQIVGLALILSVFLFVTYQDINRIF